MRVISEPAPPSVVGRDGQPALGAYRGAVPAVRWDALAGPSRRGSLYRRLHHKTWLFVSIACDPVVVALGIVDIGIAVTAFAYVFDRDARSLVAERSWTTLPGRAMVSPHPTVGASARFSSGRTRLAIDNLGGGPAVPHRYRALIDDGDLQLRAELVAARGMPTLCAVAPIEGGVANCTHKSPGFEASGHVEVGPRRFDLAGAHGAFDHTSGLLARDTRWRWASASGADVAFNLVEGFNGPVENVVWLDGELVPVGEARFDYDPKDPLAPWRITADGGLELAFTPEGARRQDKDLVLAKSWYVQPIGTFRGTLRGDDGRTRELGPILGVTEDHRALW
ncbi:MAG: DUF2804 domain-containing protein [Deltaproteobacteria bacterium]|nr:DUF2804 domain-containing protein [Deltaproteobacteria bacterium]